MLVNKIVFVKQRMCGGTNDAGIYYLANCKDATMHTFVYSLFCRFFQIRNDNSPSHDILLVSFVSPSVLEYYDSKCKMKLW